MGKRVETRSEALFSSRHAAVIEEQKLFGYFLGSWVFADTNDQVRAAKAREEIMGRAKVNQNETTKYVVETLLSKLDDSAWRWFDWAIRWALHYTNQEITAVQSGQKSPEEYQLSLNGLIENLITQVNQGSAIYQKTQASENYSQWTPEQLQAWNEENYQGDKLEGSRFIKNHVVYTYEDGFAIVKLAHPKDYEMVGTELGNCTRYERPDGWKNHPGMFALVDPEGNPKAVARFGGSDMPSDMNICYEFQSFDKVKGEQKPAKEYANYLVEFLNNTSPFAFGLASSKEETWLNKSDVQEYHPIVQSYQDGERDFSDTNLEGANLEEANLRGAYFEGTYLARANLGKADLAEANFEGANLGGAWLYEANLTGAVLWDANLRGADLTEANLEGAYLMEADLTKAVLWDANLKGANLRGAYLGNARLAGATLGGADLERANLEGANLARAHLKGANLRGARLSEAWLKGANLKGANFEGTNFEGANLSEAWLEGADLEGANFEGINFEGANLGEARLEGADLYGANLGRANLWGANLKGANLERADLEGANLEGADLRGARLSEAWLKGANLKGADLEGANLEGANLEGANLEGAILPQSPLPNQQA